MISKYSALFLAFLYAAGSSALEFSGTPDELRDALDLDYPSVAINGEAKRITYSNLAHISILVTTKENTVSESLLENAEVRTRLIKSLTNAGIPLDEIKNSKFSSSPHYGIFRGKKPSKYTVENSLRVTARTEQQLVSINQAIDSIDSAQLGQIEFEVENEKQLKEELRLEAIKDATDQGKQYGTALGLKLVPQSFSFQRTSASSGNAIEEIVVTARRVAGSRDSYQDIVTPESISFEQIEYRSSVKVIFESQPTNR